MNPSHETVGGRGWWLTWGLINGLILSDCVFVTCIHIKHSAAESCSHVTNLFISSHEVFHLYINPLLPFNEFWHFWCKPSAVVLEQVWNRSRPSVCAWCYFRFSLFRWGQRERAAVSELRGGLRGRPLLRTSPAQMFSNSSAERALVSGSHSSL